MDQNFTDLVHPDILQTHILTRLDGPTLASAGSTSCQLRRLSSDNSLWRDNCHKTWPSTANPRLCHLLTSFPSGYRSFYADSYSTVHHNHKSSPLQDHSRWSSTTLISAVDIKYENKNIFSKVLETDNPSGRGGESSFQVELLSSRESFPLPGKFDVRDLKCESDLENSLTLSWIVIEPTLARAANLTSFKAVSVDREWSTGDIEVRFGTILCGEKKGELVECAVVVTCGGWGNEDLHVKQVRLEIEDIEGNSLGWRVCVGILQEAIENGDKTRGGERGGYEEFTEMKEATRERKLRKERRQEEVGICTGAVIVVGFWVFATVGFFHLVCSYFLFSFSWGRFVELMY